MALFDMLITNIDILIKTLHSWHTLKNIDDKHWHAFDKLCHTD